MRSRDSPRTARGIATLAVVLALVLAGGTAALLAVCPAEYLRRAVTLGDADVGDMAVFRARPIPAGGTPWVFVDAKAPGRTEALAARAGLGASQPAFLESTGTLACVVAKDDRLLHEGYFGGQSRDAPVTSFSVAKSILSSLVGIAIAEGRIGSVDGPVTRWLPELAARRARRPRGDPARVARRRGPRLAVRAGPRVVRRPAVLRRRAGSRLRALLLGAAESRRRARPGTGCSVRSPRPREEQGTAGDRYAFEAELQRRAYGQGRPLHHVMIRLLAALLAGLRRDRAAKVGWDAATPGRRRGLAYFVASAKTPATVASRVAKVLDDLTGPVPLRRG
jgi:hypothetical protein